MSQSNDIINHYIKLKSFKQKNILVSGATGAIGSEVVRLLLKCGAFVIGLIHKKENMPIWLYDYIKTGQFTYYVIDLENDAKIVEAFKQCLTRFGGLLNSLIICHGKFIAGNVTDIQIQDFDKSLNINVRSNFQLLSLATPFLKLSKGNCVMISSVETKIVERGDFLHALNKNMINSLVQNAALELASFGVRVNAVAPGFVNSKFRVDEFLGEQENNNYLTQMKNYSLLQKKIIEPIEVANCILFLASEESRFMTGEIMTIDAGFELNHDCSFQQNLE